MPIGVGKTYTSAIINMYEFYCCSIVDSFINMKRIPRRRKKWLKKHINIYKLYKLVKSGKSYETSVKTIFGR